MENCSLSLRKMERNSLVVSLWCMIKNTFMKRLLATSSNVFSSGPIRSLCLKWRYALSEVNLGRHVERLITEGYTLNPEKFKHLNQWNMAVFQLVVAKSSIQSLIEVEPKTGEISEFANQYALMSGAVMSYYKCFSETEARQVKFDAKQVFKDAPELRMLHDELALLRHKMLAHNEPSALYDYVHLGLAAKEGEDHFKIAQYINISLPRGKYLEWLQLFQYVHQYALSRIKKYMETLELELGKPIVSKPQ